MSPEPPELWGGSGDRLRMSKMQGWEELRLLMDYWPPPHLRLCIADCACTWKGGGHTCFSREEAQVQNCMPGSPWVSRRVRFQLWGFFLIFQVFQGKHGAERERDCVCVCVCVKSGEFQTVSLGFIRIRNWDNALKFGSRPFCVTLCLSLN